MRQSMSLALRLVLATVCLTTACVPGTAEEVAMGNDYAQQIERQLPIVRDPEIVRYINVLGDSIARVVDNRELTWRFNVVDEAEINAFAVPGGHIYVNRGLIERTTNMSELAGVLGHEIAHVTQRHSMKQMASELHGELDATLRGGLAHLRLGGDVTDGRVDLEALLSEIEGRLEPEPGRATGDEDRVRRFANTAH